MQVSEKAASSPDFASQRQTMVDCQVRTFDVTDLDVIGRFETVPREEFVPGPMRSLAYSDAPLDVRSDDGHVRTLLPPLVLARMIQGADVTSDDRVLDVAGACGYTAALLAGLCREVVALESSADFASRAGRSFSALGLSNARAVLGKLDGSSLEGPFDVILVNGGIEAGYESLIARLSPRGRLIAIHMDGRGGGERAAKAARFDKVGAEASRRALFDTAGTVLTEFRRPPAFVF
jgi:protein-L-isoaspartate(D-aspartate) O-methyltransferase